ncbi:MAG: hypothetical protein QOG99_1403 [Frankiales bacterium]|jgi:hypothetical protein|nr:hypothetical protein [Frankiales bacterium]
MSRVRTGTWSYDVDVHAADATPAAAMALLSDITRQGELHPLITKVEELPPIEGALRSYAITDSLRLGPVPFRITYRADTLSVSDTEVVTVARQRPRTTIRNRTTVTPTSGGVHVHVDVELTAPSLLFRYAYREGHKAHLELAERIRSVLQASQG